MKTRALILGSLLSVSVLSAGIVLASSREERGFNEAKVQAVIQTKMEKYATPQQVNIVERQADRQENRGDFRTNREDEKTGAEANRQEMFCTQFSETASKMSERMTERKGTFDNRKENRASTFDVKREERDSTYTENRADQDMHRSEMYVKLNGNATTDTQKAAVKKFQDSVEAAVASRRSAMDTAIETFRKEVDSAVTTRKSSMDSSVSAFTKASNTAVSSAKASCLSGKTPAEVRSRFQSDMDAAREKLKSDQSQMEKVQNDVKALLVIRKSAVEEAINTFKSTMEVAKEELKRAFEK